MTTNIIPQRDHLRSVLIVAFRNLPASEVLATVAEAWGKVEKERSA